MVTGEYLASSDPFILNAMNALKKLDEMEHMSNKEEVSCPTGDKVSKTRPLELRHRITKSREYWHADTVPLGKTWNYIQHAFVMVDDLLVCSFCVSSRINLSARSPRLLRSISNSNDPLRQEWRVSTSSSITRFCNRIEGLNSSIFLSKMVSHAAMISKRAKVNAKLSAYDPEPMSLHARNRSTGRTQNKAIRGSKQSWMNLTSCKSLTCLTSFLCRASCQGRNFFDCDRIHHKKNKSKHSRTWRRGQTKMQNVYWRAQGNWKRKCRMCIGGQREIGRCPLQLNWCISPCSYLGND